MNRSIRPSLKLSRAVYVFAAVAALGVAGSVQAKYLCDEPPTQADRRACEAAEQGPDTLRHFIQRTRMIFNLHFPDYVNEARIVAWQEMEARARDLSAEQDLRTTTASAERR